MSMQNIVTITSEVNSVLNGSRKIGAKMLDKMLTAEYFAIVNNPLLKVLIIDHSKTEKEIVYSLSLVHLSEYKQAQENRKDNLIDNNTYWNITGKLFNYSQADINGFITWISEAPHRCPCKQCFPAL